MGDLPKILLIEDETGIAEGLSYQLQREGFVVAHEADGRSGLDRFLKEGADLVLLDLMLPEMSGQEVCSAIRRDSDVPIIMLTARDDDVDKIVGLELGADDYVTKPFNTRELLARIKAVLRRRRAKQAMGDAVLEGGGIRLDADRYEVTVRGDLVHLPKKEFEILELLMARAGRAISREELIEEVWGADYVGDTRTLDVHIKRLRGKCEADPADPRHLLTIRGFGYRFVP